MTVRLLMCRCAWEDTRGLAPVVRSRVSSRAAGLSQMAAPPHPERRRGASATRLDCVIDGAAWISEPAACISGPRAVKQREQLAVGRQGSVVEDVPRRGDHGRLVQLSHVVRLQDG